MTDLQSSVFGGYVESGDVKRIREGEDDLYFKDEISQRKMVSDRRKKRGDVMARMLRNLSVVLLMCATPLAAQSYGWVKEAQLTTPASSIEFIDSLHGWAAGGSDAIYRTTNGGLTWIAYSSTAPFLVKSISFTDSLNGWIVGTDGITGDIIHTTDGGKTWSWQLEKYPRQYLATHSFSKNRNITIGQTHHGISSLDSGMIAETTDGGKTWTEQTTSDSIFLYKIQFADSLRGWIVADINKNGGLLRTRDGGHSWEVLTGPLFRSICFIDSLNGWGIAEVPSGGEIFRTTDGGVSWTSQFCICTAADELGPQSISFVDSLHGWAFGTIFFEGASSAAIYKTTDGGQSWGRDFVTHDAGGLAGGQMLSKVQGWTTGGGFIFAYEEITAVVEQLPETPHSFSLHQNYPNPFNPQTNIEYELKQVSPVILTIFDVNGKEVRKLVNTKQEAGVYRVHFQGSGLASGVYYYTLTAGSYTNTKTMVLLK
jgi:photosystem II stability/assembly factor-like uncharacterized protein